MKLAASNIAWDSAEDDAVARVLRDRGFTGVEIAPSRRWRSPADATAAEIAEYRDEWEKRGLRIVAMQALLFGRSDLQLFGPEPVRAALREYLASILRMASGLGAEALVFGSPRNRRRGTMPLHEATKIAADFFRDLGESAAALGCVICIEPNPESYDCDFLTTTAEAVTFCKQVASRGIRVNGDAGAIASNGEDSRAALTAACEWLGHFHASEPSLVEVGDGPVHRQSADTLRDCGYTGWISVEMRGGDAHRVDAIARAADCVRRVYGP